MIPDHPSPRRSLPSVDRVLRDLGGRPTVSHDILTRMVREELTAARRDGISAGMDDIVARLEVRLDSQARPRLASIINGTGVILHTNLGRAPVSVRTAAAMAEAAASYVPLEIEPDSNLRGGRMHEISELMLLLCGAERALVVNNNAAALLLSLTALAGGREVIVSRGEAVEIGGGFRVPEVVAQGGSRLVDVGTTNKTRADDYERAIGPLTGALLKVHPSNFVIDGFAAEASIADLAAAARPRGVPLVHDIGSGALLDPTRFGLRAEPTFQSSLRDGADVVTASGDKLLGGPQAGIICGRAEMIGLIEQHPLARALRADKVTLAGVATTLRHYVTGDASTEIPVWRMISTTVDDLGSRAAKLSVATGWPVVQMSSTVGGGSLPGEEIASVGVAWADEVELMAGRLRRGQPRVFGRIRDGRLLIDLRTVSPDQDTLLASALGSVTASTGA